MHGDVLGVLLLGKGKASHALTLCPKLIFFMYYLTHIWS